jgi:cobalt-zinc-cadmium efflux system protein
VEGAYLEVWSDMLGSLGVIAGALAIRFTGWSWIDPAVAVGIGLWVLPRTWSLLKASTHILLEGTPADVDIAKLRACIELEPGVTSVHDLHVWTLTTRRNVLTAHVVRNEKARPELLQVISQRCRHEFGIFHTTIQLEDESCGELHEPTDGAPAHPDDHGGDHGHGHSH